MDHGIDGEAVGTRGLADAGGTGVHLVVLRHVVVAQDIAQTVQDIVPGASVIVAASSTEALAALANIERLALAFVGEGPRGFRGSPLDGAVAARGGRVVLMGGEAEAEGAALGFDVMVRPFSVAAVLAYLRDR